jgi:hypothetical protein
VECAAPGTPPAPLTVEIGRAEGRDRDGGFRLGAEYVTCSAPALRRIAASRCECRYRYTLVLFAHAHALTADVSLRGASGRLLHAQRESNPQSPAPAPAAC